MNRTNALWASRGQKTAKTLRGEKILLARYVPSGRLCDRATGQKHHVTPRVHVITVHKVITEIKVMTGYTKTEPV